MQVGDDTLDIGALADRLLADLEGRDDKGVFLRGDSEITYGELVSVIDQIKEGGVEDVGLVLDQPRQR